MLTTKVFLVMATFGVMPVSAWTNFLIIPISGGSLNRPLFSKSPSESPTYLIITPAIYMLLGASTKKYADRVKN